MEKVGEETPRKKLHGFEFWKSIGSPRYICAPMVEQSDLAFRLLCKRYGCEMGYTPMLHSRVMQDCPHYLKKHFQTCAEDRPMIAQLCGNEPEMLLKACQMIEDRCDAVDINLGCPQGIARKGNYGSFLLENEDLVVYDNNF
jgi:tRNA-dihydrouridine synthase 1